MDRDHSCRTCLLPSLEVGNISPRVSTPPHTAARVWAAAASISRAHFIVGMTNSAPSLMPEGQREVTVLVLV